MTAVTSNALSLLGLALRGGNLAVGEEPVGEACKTGRARLVLTAADASLNSVDRARRWAENGGVPWLPVPWGKEALGGALGRGSCAMAALTDRGLAAALIRKLAEADPAYQPLAGNWAGEVPRPQPMKKKKPRARRKPAVREI